MRTLHRSENLQLKEEDYGGLSLYLKGITINIMENKDYDVAFNFDGIDLTELVSLANGILAYVECDSSIE
tara:strand:+ start:37 stop:246 length:210 start_codon:yes stop_codon:yes gene_type:complete